MDAEKIIRTKDTIYKLLVAIDRNFLQIASRNSSYILLLSRVLSRIKIFGEVSVL